MALVCTEEDQGFGFKFIHGSNRPRYNGDMDYYVTEVVANGVADRTGLVGVGDNIKTVNGVSIQEVDFDQVYNLFRTSGSNAVIHLQKKYDDPRISKMV